jgi:pilus assembly protein CpaF
VEALAVAAGLGRDAVHAQLAAGIQLVVHLRRDTAGRRRVAEIAALLRRAGGLVEAEPAVRFAPDGSASVGPAGAVLESLLVGAEQ